MAIDSYLFVLLIVGDRAAIVHRSSILNFNSPFLQARPELAVVAIAATCKEIPRSLLGINKRKVAVPRLTRTRSTLMTSFSNTLVAIMCLTAYARHACRWLSCCARDSSIGVRW